MSDPAPDKFPALYNTSRAKNPYGPGEIDVYVAKSLIRGISKASFARMRNFIHLVPKALLETRLIFRCQSDGSFYYFYEAGSIHVDVDEGCYAVARRRLDDELFCVSLDENRVLSDWWTLRKCFTVANRVLPPWHAGEFDVFVK